jgi:hypothetical protein
MRPHEHADDLTPEQRFQIIAAILAAGLRRLRPRTPFLPDPAEQTAAKKPPEFSPDCLEFSAETRLSGQSG